MNKEILNKKDFADHVRATINNTEELNRKFEAMAACVSADADEMSTFVGVLFLEKDNIQKQVEEMWPWLFVDDISLGEALYTIANEYINECEE